MDREIMIALIVFAVTVGWLINNWIRAKHGYPLEDDWGGLVEKRTSGFARRTANSTTSSTPCRIA